MDLTSCPGCDCVRFRPRAGCDVGAPAPVLRYIIRAFRAAARSGNLADTEELPGADGGPPGPSATGVARPRSTRWSSDVVGPVPASAVTADAAVWSYRVSLRRRREVP